MLPEHINAWQIRLNKRFRDLILGLDFFTVNIFLRLTVKILSFLRLTAKVLAVLRLTVNPIETLFKRAIVVSWLIPTMYTVLPLAWDTNRTKTIHIVYVVCLEIFGVVVPYIFITFAYVRIFRKARHSLTTRKNFESAGEQRKDRRRVSSDAQVAKVFCTISTAFLLSWFPILYLTTVYSVLNLPDLIPDALFTILLFTVATSSLVNPLIYAFFKPDFRVAIRNFCRKNSQTKAVTKKASIPSSSPRTKTEEKTKQKDQTVEKHESNSSSGYETKL